MAYSPTAPEAARAITGPVLLILTGALFLVDYSGGYTVSQTWPLLLIAAGLGKVAEHLVSPPPPPKAPY
jgi:hypothetical protein